MPFYVYILASERNGTLYVGVTNDLVRRVSEHRLGVVEGFSKKYGVKDLVYFEVLDDPENAIQREKHIKKWNRAWKIELIEKENPQWVDRYDDIQG
jgi:putative endonuclease